MKPIDDLIERVTSNGHKVDVSGATSEIAIVAVEARLGVRFPPSFRTFLADYGWLAIGDVNVSGIDAAAPMAASAGTVLGDTLRFREEWSMPPYLIVVQADEDAPYCFDPSQAGAGDEWPVVCFELHTGHIGKPVAADFIEWTRDFVFAWALPDAR